MLIVNVITRERSNALNASSTYTYPSLALKLKLTPTHADCYKLILCFLTRSPIVKQIVD